MVEALSDEMIEKMNKYWNAANYLSVGQLYLLDNPQVWQLSLKNSHISIENACFFMKVSVE